MPQIRHFTVTQTREVKITANSLADAARIAEVAFENGQTNDNTVRHSDDRLHGVWGNTSSRIHAISLHVHEGME